MVIKWMKDNSVFHVVRHLIILGLNIFLESCLQSDTDTDGDVDAAFYTNSAN